MNLRNNNRPKINQHEVQHLIHLSNFQKNFHYHILPVFYFLHFTRYTGSFLCMHCLSIQQIKRVQCQVMKATLKDWNSPEDQPPALLLPGPSITGRLDSRFYTSQWPVGLKSDRTTGRQRKTWRSIRHGPLSHRCLHATDTQRDTGPWHCSSNGTDDGTRLIARRYVVRHHTFNLNLRFAHH